MLTAAQRARKVATAKKRIIEARVLLQEVCDDYSENGYRLSVDERADWSTAVALCVPLERLAV